MSENLSTEIENAFAGLRKAARVLRSLSTQKKNAALLAIADKLSKSEAEILKANAEDLAALPNDAAMAFRDRLTLNPQRLEGMRESLRQVAALPDPVGEVAEEKVLKNGLLLRRVRSPLGVILMIFESRPNVILEAFSLAFKTGNAIALRGGRETKNTARVFYRLMQESLKESGLPELSFYGFNDYDRSLVEKLLLRKDLVDIVVPRGGDKLIEFVETTAVMPIIKNDRGLCHAFIDETADLDMAVRIVDNAKTQRPGVCNSLETVLVHKTIAENFFAKLTPVLKAKNVEFRCDDQSFALVKAADGNAVKASDRDFDTEHLDLILNCRIVNDLADAIAHIEKHGSRHSETIITKSETNARQFQNDIDAAAVYWNASTRFTDGFEFGLGGELGISTQKLHVRGPVGLRELTTPRWIIDGTGQTR
ncbi:MAG TPA: glutamate-5-semialdehyde dehydrogenase [Bdellovibrionales bacterium]|nr:glutamate-5-semialdehyde dehydrogenase [Bdellovibrionales bacterium]